MYTSFPRKRESIWINWILAIAFALLLSCSGMKIGSQLKNAEELIGTRKFDEAVQIYKLITDRYPNDEKTAVAYLKMGDLYFYTFSDTDKALESYSYLIGKWPLTDEAHDATLRKAEVFNALGRPASAIGEYEWVLAHFPDYSGRFQIRMQIGEAYLNLQDAYQASLELEELLKEKDMPEDVRGKALFYLGESYMYLQEYEKAMGIFKKLMDNLKDAPYALDAGLGMVECLERLGKMEEAVSLQKELVKKYPESDMAKRRAKSLIDREKKVKKPE